MSQSRAKALGAYYTDALVADFLTRWAACEPLQTVLDPSCGDGVFLRAAAEVLGPVATRILGVDISPQAVRDARSALPAAGNLEVWEGDFLGLEPTFKVDAVLGNPPYVRYQRLAKRARQQLAARARSQGVKLDGKAGLWAGFVLHAASFIKEGGSLGLVLPAELLRADYAKNVLGHLTETYRDIFLVTFDKALFPKLDQGVLLLLARGKGERCQSLRYVPLEAAGALAGAPPAVLSKGVGLEPRTLKQGRSLMALAASGSAPLDLLDLYARLQADTRTRLLGEVATVKLGYVSGHNAFFQLSPSAAQKLGLPANVLKPALFRSFACRGLSFNQEDWQQAASAQGAQGCGYLLSVPAEAQEQTSAELQAYLATGVAQGVPFGYKCKRRRFWFAVPAAQRADALVSAMNGLYTVMCANDSNAAVSNNFHALTLSQPYLNAKTLAALWQTSLLQLSAELEGRTMGGGMLKLEPADVKRLRVPNVQEDLTDLAGELDGLLRAGKRQRATQLADAHILQGILGLSPKECASLQQGAERLRSARYYRNKHRPQSSDQSSER